MTDEQAYAAVKTARARSMAALLESCGGDKALFWKRRDRLSRDNPGWWLSFGNVANVE